MIDINQTLSLASPQYCQQLNSNLLNAINVFKTLGWIQICLIIFTAIVMTYLIWKYAGIKKEIDTTIKLIPKEAKQNEVV